MHVQISHIVWTNLLAEVASLKERVETLEKAANLRPFSITGALEGSVQQPVILNPSAVGNPDETPIVHLPGFRGNPPPVQLNPPMPPDAPQPMHGKKGKRS